MSHDFRTRTNFCRWPLLVALAFISIGVHAQAVDAPSAFDKFLQRATGAGKQTVGFGSNGTPLVNPGVPTITPDGGMPRVDAVGSIRNPSGNLVPVSSTARIPAAEVSKAVGRSLARLAAKVAVPIVAGMELYDLAKEIGHILSRNPDGSVGIVRAVCAEPPCKEYTQEATYGLPWDSTPSAAAVRWAAHVNTLQSVYTYVHNGDCDATACGYNRTTRSNGTVTPVGMIYVSRNGSDSVAVTEQEFLDAVAAKSGWPSGSAIARVLADSSTQGDEKVKAGPSTVIGPATSPGTTTTTTNTTNNTTKTETTTHHHTYEGPTVTTTTVTVTNIVNNTTGDTISNETTTEAAKPDPVEDQCAVYPDSLGCSELGDQEETPMPARTENITFTPVTFQSNATCPPPLAITGNLPTMGSFNYSLSYSGICDGAGIIRLFLLAGATLVGIGIFVGGLKS